MEKTGSSPSSLSQHLQPGPRKEECFSHSDLLIQQHFFQRQKLLRQDLVIFFGRTYLGHAGWHSCCCSQLQETAAVVQVEQKLCGNSFCEVSCYESSFDDVHGVFQVSGVQLLGLLLCDLLS